MFIGALHRETFKSCTALQPHGPQWCLLLGKENLKPGSFIPQVRFVKESMPACSCQQVSDQSGFEMNGESPHIQHVDAHECHACITACLNRSLAPGDGKVRKSGSIQLGSSMTHRMLRGKGKKSKQNQGQKENKAWRCQALGPRDTSAAGSHQQVKAILAALPKP